MSDDSHPGFLADLHVHSYLSRATSKLCDLPHLAMWAQRKGIRLLGTGDFTHPEWFGRISEQLEPRDNGLYRLKPELREGIRAEVPAACQGPVDFVLQVEISSIYKRGGRVRKVHNLVFMPDLEAARRLCEALGRIGNIGSDGRPILGLDSRDLLEIVLECSDRAYLIPAHIWTPWFSVFGSKSGFDELQECYGDLTSHIFALETGLSSDPPMNWRLSQLDGLTLVSNSDAHSPAKLGREANLFRTEVTYDAVFEALHGGDPARFGGTLEFYPQEGKYHLDGCRRCGVRLEPDQTREHGGRCPECGKLVTVGVMSRVEDLADRPPGARPDTAFGFESLVPLQEVLARCFDQGPATKRVQREYDRLLIELGPELTILRSLPVDALQRAGSPLLAESIRRVRAGELRIHPGYDGEYGVIRIFGAGERERLLGQAELFAVPAVALPGAEPPEPLPEGVCGVTPDGQLNLFGVRSTARPAAAAPGGSAEDSGAEPLLRGLTDEQRAAVEHESTPLLIVAGPGAGKTRTLTRRIAHRVRGGVAPGRVLAVTFTHRAAAELRRRLAGLLDPAAAAAMTVTTFHGLGLGLLRAHGSELGLPTGFAVLGERAAAEVLALELGVPTSAALRKRVQAIGNAKLLPPGTQVDEALRGDLEVYGQALARQSAVDYADLILRAVSLLRERPDRAAQVQQRWTCFAVDEYQDIDPWQRELLRLLVGEATDLCAIGDPDQSIYGFRGADVTLFAAFLEDYRAVQRASLGVSFRSTPAIIGLAREVVRHAPDFGRVAMSAARGPGVGDRPELQLFSSPAAEAVEVARRIEDLVGGVRSLTDASDHRREGELGFGDIAVLARTGARLDPVAEALARLGVPTERAGVVEADEGDETALAALLALYTGRATPAELLTLLAREGVTGPRLAGVLPALADGSAEACVRAGRDVPGARPKARRALSRLTGFLERLCERCGAPEADPAETLPGALPEVLAEAAACLELTWPPELEARSLTWLWAEASQGAGQGTQTQTVDALLDRRALRATEDPFEGRVERVALLTLHAAKGLEFRAVFIVGCEDGTLPWIRAGADGPESPHEERRLLYVGMTRAMDRLWLGAARRLRRHGETREVPPSRFLGGVSPQLLRVTQHRLPRRIHQRQLDL